MNRILQRYLDDLRRELQGLPFRDQDTVLAEVEQHLESAAAEHRKAGKSPDEAMLQATHDFGAPSEIGVQYGPEAGVFDKSTGEVILRIAVLTGRGLGQAAKATGRGVGRVVKWTAIALAGLAVLGTLVFLVLAVTYKDAITQSVDNAVATRTVYSKADAETTPQTSAPFSESFGVDARARSVEVAIQATVQTGCLRIQVTDPTGAVAYDNGDGCSSVTVRQSFTAQGTWKVQYTYVAWTGRLSVEATQVAF